MSEKTEEALPAVSSAESVELWKRMIALEGQTFRTTGRGPRPGIPFTYEISRGNHARGRHYPGESVEGYGNELWIIDDSGEKKKKSITRSTVELGCRRALALNGKVSGPKKLGLPGAGSYLYPVFVKLGIIKTEAKTEAQNEEQLTTGEA